MHLQRATFSHMDRDTLQALAAGRMPAGVAEGSTEARSYAAILRAVAEGQTARDSHPLDADQLAQVVQLLRS